MRNLWVLLLVVPAFAGCLGGEDTEEPEHDHMDHDHDADLAMENVTVANALPVVTLVVREAANITLVEQNGTDANGTADGNATQPDDNSTADGNATTDGNATEPAPTYAVTIPMNVTFDITFADEDGEDLTWSLDVNDDGVADTEGIAVSDNGTYLPFNFTYSYTDVGDFAVTLTAADNETEISSALVIRAQEPVEDVVEGAFEDRGWYEFDPATSLCHVKEYTAAGVVYYTELGGGNWVLAETNGIAGLQVANGEHPGGASFDPSAGDDCLDGDLVVA